MVATRQDAWSEDDDLLLAEVTLRHIREGSTQLAAFEEVGFRLGRTAAACGFRWNSTIRKKYESAIQIAKAQRQQLKSRGKSRFIPDGEVSYAGNSHNRMQEYGSSSFLNNGYSNQVYQGKMSSNQNQNQNYPTQSSPSYPTQSHPNVSYSNQGYQTNNNFKMEASREFMPTSTSYTNQMNQMDEVSFDDVIRFLRQQKEGYKKTRQLDKELREKDLEIMRLREENEKMKQELGSVQHDYQSINEDYKALIKIMDRARKLALLSDDEPEEKVSFKMDKNGNLERVEK